VAKIKISEVFFSLQAEGLYVGVPSIFIRTFGCNFKCAGFGIPKGDKLSTIADDVALQRKDHPEWTIETLPLAKTGCDSYFSWHPKFKDMSPTMDIEQIIHEVEMARLIYQPNGPRNGLKDSHIVITGGEPLLGWQKSYPALLDKLAETGYRHITFETNGTQKICDEFADYLLLNHINGKRLNITFSVSPKLPCSREKLSKALQPNIITDYMKYGKVYLKFVIANQHDLDDVNEFVHGYKAAGYFGEVYLMPLGGTVDDYMFNSPQVAALAMHSGYRYSPRLQVDLWGNKTGT